MLSGFWKMDIKPLSGLSVLFYCPDADVFTFFESSLIYHTLVTVIIYKSEKCRKIVAFENKVHFYRAQSVTRCYLVLLSVKLPHLYFEKCEKRLSIYRIDFCGTVRYTVIRRSKKTLWIFSTKSWFPSNSTNPKSSAIPLSSIIRWSQNAV